MSPAVPQVDGQPGMRLMSRGCTNRRENKAQSALGVSSTYFAVARPGCSIPGRAPASLAVLQHFWGTLGDESKHVHDGLLPKVSSSSTAVPAGGRAVGQGAVSSPGQVVWGSEEGKQRVHAELGGKG